MHGMHVYLHTNHIRAYFIDDSYRLVFLSLYSAAHGRDHSAALPVTSRVVIIVIENSKIAVIIISLFFNIAESDKILVLTYYKLIMLWQIYKLFTLIDTTIIDSLYVTFVF